MMNYLGLPWPRLASDHNVTTICAFSKWQFAAHIYLNIATLQEQIETKIDFIYYYIICYNCRTHIGEYVTIERHAIIINYG